MEPETGSMAGGMPTGHFDGSSHGLNLIVTTQELQQYQFQTTCRYF